MEFGFKPSCIEPVAGNRLGDTVACIDHAQPATPTSVTDTVTDTFLNSYGVFIVVVISSRYEHYRLPCVVETPKIYRRTVKQ